MAKPKVSVSPNMKKVSEYINSNGDKLDKLKGRIVEKKEDININEIQDTPETVEPVEKKSSMSNKIEEKINSKINEMIDKKIDEILSKML